MSTAGSASAFMTALTAASCSRASSLGPRAGVFFAAAGVGGVFFAPALTGEVSARPQAAG
jgi:hypothetical protein